MQTVMSFDQNKVKPIYIRYLHIYYNGKSMILLNDVGLQKYVYKKCFHTCQNYIT